MASVKNPFKGQGKDGGFGSAFPRIRCQIYLGCNYPFLCRILNVSIEETISLCFSNRPLRVKWNATCEMESISCVILTFKSYKDNISFSSWAASYFLSSFGYSALGSYGLAYPSAYPSAFVCFFAFLRGQTTGIIALPSAST